MKGNLKILLFALLCCLTVNAQPLARRAPGAYRHHTQRLPGVNERRLARLEKMRQANIARRHRQGPWRANTLTETKKGLVLLVEFSGLSMQSGAAAEWQKRFNQQGYSQYDHVGSVRDYFSEQSYGQLLIDFDVVGPLKLSNTQSYYGTAPNSKLDDRAAEMVIEALEQADPQVNYADYDWDGDGWVDQVYVIYAGQTEYGVQGYIWPHEWSLDGAKYYGNGSGYQNMDGVGIDTYAVSNELADDTTLEGIGTACHEFSHCLGYPDFYDVNYSGGTAAQYWDVMDGGSYNGPQYIGEVPSPFTAYERWTAGWIDLIPLSEPCKVNDMPAINEEGVAYVITNSGNANEYYILENRQQVTFGTCNGGHGLMLWHIDYSKTAWENNEVNAVKSHQRMTFLPADGQVGVLSGSADEGYYYDITAEDEAGDPYPGRQNVTEVKPLTWFTAESKGTKTHPNLIKQIAETADGKISFVYGDYSPIDTPEVTEPTDVSPDYFTANWLPVEGATSYTLQVKTSNGEAEPTVLLEEDFSGFSSVKDNVEVKNMDTYAKAQGWTATTTYGTGDAAIRVTSSKKLGSVTTPALTSETGELVVEFDASYYNTDGSSIVVSVLNGTTTVAQETVPVTSERATYTLAFSNVPSGSKVMFASTAAKKRFYLYNVKILDSANAASKPVTYEGLTTTSYTVELEGAETCSYRVQAVCSDGTSAWSDWMDVDMASAISEISANAVQKGTIYDLSGRRLQQLPRQNFYILDGKVRMKR